MSKKMYSFTKNIFILSTSVGPKTGTYFLFLFHCVHFLRILLNGLPSQTLWNLQLKHFFFFSACHCLFRWSNWFFNSKITSRIQISARKTVFNRGVYLNKYKSPHLEGASHNGHAAISVFPEIIISSHTGASCVWEQTPQNILTNVLWPRRSRCAFRCLLEWCLPERFLQQQMCDPAVGAV